MKITVLGSVFSASIMDAVYGIVVAERDDPVLTRAEQIAATFSNIVVPGRYMVELLPSLRFLPSWLPGARFKRDAKRWRTQVIAARDETYDVFMESMVSLTLFRCTKGMDRTKRQSLGNRKRSPVCPILFGRDGDAERREHLRGTRTTFPKCCGSSVSR